MIHTLLLGLATLGIVAVVALATLWGGEICHGNSPQGPRIGGVILIAGCP